MFHLKTHFRINKKKLFLRVTFYYIFLIPILKLCAFISFFEEMQFLMPQAIETEEQYLLLNEWSVILNIASLQKEKTNLEGTNIPSGDKISSYIQVFLNSQWTTRNSFRNASWHAGWATFQTIAIIFLKLRVFLFLLDFIEAAIHSLKSVYLLWYIYIISLISCTSKNC